MTKVFNPTSILILTNSIVCGAAGSSLQLLRVLRMSHGLLTQTLISPLRRKGQI